MMYWHTCLKGCWPKELWLICSYSTVLVELCSFFRKLCSKVLIVKELNQLQSKIILIFCHLEMIFPPSFFIMMAHLTVYLIHETKLIGLTQYQWMYSIERYSFYICVSSLLFKFACRPFQHLVSFFLLYFIDFLGNWNLM